MNAEAWDALRTISKDQTITERRPNVGRRVRVVEGKHLGAEGVVRWHGVGRFDAPKWRYGDSMSMHMRDLMGQYGFTVKVAEDNGQEFWIAAEKVCVL